MSYQVYHWDTFDDPGEDTSLLETLPTLKEAEEYVEKHYKGRIGPNGADQVHIVDSGGNVVKRYHVS